MSPHRRVIPSTPLLVAVATILVGVNAPAVTIGATTEAPLLNAPSASQAGTVTADSLTSGSTELLPTPVTVAPTDYTTTTVSTTSYSETSSHIVYHGSWSSASYSGYLGGRIKYSKQRSASAVLSFTGTAVSWIGPVGPTRGKAMVYVNGHYVRTVNLYASSFVARRTIWSSSWSTQAARTLKIVVLGTAGHPTVNIDSFTIRRLITTTVPAPTTPGVTVNVSSISALKSALANNAVDRIVVANGTYHVSPSGDEASNSLWIGGGAIATRTRPIVVQAETRGGVIFDGGGGSGYAGLSFEDGAHDQVWDGFVFQHMTAYSSGIIEFGGYVPRRTPHDITLRFISISRTCLGRGTYIGAPTLDHAIYISNAKTVGPNHLLFEDVTVDGRGGLASAVHFDHGDALNPNATDVVVRRLHVIGTQQALILWEPPVHRITFEDVDITGALSHAIRFESIGASGVVFSGITSTGTGAQPFWSSLGLHPAGMTITGSSLN